MKLELLLPPLLLQLLSLAAVECQLQCNSATSIRQKRIVIRSPVARELSMLDSCQYEVAPSSSQVCQVRIDIERLELPQPRLNATSQLLECVDFMQVQRFKLCGRNNGQHLYVQLQRGQTLKLHFNIGSHSTQSTWQLTLTQLECPQNMLAMAKKPTNTDTNNASQLPTVRTLLPFLSNFLPRTIFGGNPGNGPAAQLFQTLTAPSSADLELLAPLGCDQYYRSSSGGIASFNFAGGIYMPNMKYAICVAGAANTEISYSLEHFSLSQSSSSSAPGPGYDENCHSTVITPGRAMDYLLIPNSYMANNQALQPTYYCGNQPVGSKIIARPPFVIYFSSDEQTNASETGFQINYTVRRSQLLL